MFIKTSHFFSNVSIAYRKMKTMPVKEKLNELAILCIENDILEKLDQIARRSKLFDPWFLVVFYSLYSLRTPILIQILFLIRSPNTYPFHFIPLLEVDPRQFHSQRWAQIQLTWHTSTSITIFLKTRIVPKYISILGMELYLASSLEKWFFKVSYFLRGAPFFLHRASEISALLGTKLKIKIKIITMGIYLFFSVNVSYLFATQPKQ